MNSTIFTIGFTQKTAQEFFQLLQEAQVQKLIDIREKRGGQLAGFAKHPDLAFFLDRLLGIQYDYQPIFAPSPEIRKAYRRTRDWEQYETSFLELMEQRNAWQQAEPGPFEGRVALLCSEAEPDKCHRRLVAEMLATRWRAQGHEVEIQHLVIPKSATPRKPRPKAHAGADPL
jgi:uncharacterized protein (DUF488 family)